MDLGPLLDPLGLDRASLVEGDLEVVSPIDGSVIARLGSASANQAAEAVGRAREAFVAWRSVPPPRRGELIRQLGQVLRERKEVLGELVSVESGKILQEGRGEVQEMIDICDFAVGINSRYNQPVMIFMNVELCPNSVSSDYGFHCVPNNASKEFHIRCSFQIFVTRHYEPE